MKIKTGDMWSCLYMVDKFVVTTNAIIKRNGALVMGAGIAKECRDRFDGIDIAIGTAIKRKGSEYGFLEGAHVCAFQVKHHFADNADLALIRKSTGMLRQFALDNPRWKIALNFPGIGNGRLAGMYEEILEIISVLPDNVTVWKFK